MSEYASIAVDQTALRNPLILSLSLTRNRCRKSEVNEHDAITVGAEHAPFTSTSTKVVIGVMNGQTFTIRGLDDSLVQLVIKESSYILLFL